jgi:hypothetical protein
MRGALESALVTTERTTDSVPTDRSHRDALMEQHRAARARRDAAPLGSEAFREALEEIARIEIEIARREEPPPKV